MKLRILPLLFLFFTHSACSALGGRVPIRPGEFYVETGAARGLSSTLSYTPPQAIAADAAARMANRLEDSAKVQAASDAAGKSGGRVTVTICAPTVGTGNTEWLELIVSDRSGTVTERLRGDFEVPDWSSPRRCWWNVMVKTLKEPVSETTTVRVLHHVSNAYTDYIIWNGDYASRIGKTRPTGLQAMFGAR